MKKYYLVLCCLISAAWMSIPACSNNSHDPLYTEPGPYEVGVTTLDLTDYRSDFGEKERLVEVYYPISYSGNRKLASYTTFDILTEELRDLLYSVSPELVAELNDLSFAIPAYRDAPISIAGPFPVLTFSHGHGGFRLAYSNLLAGIASHGFIVASIDHLEWGVVYLLMETLGMSEEEIETLLGQPLEASNLVLATLDMLDIENTIKGGLFEGGVDVSLAAAAGHSQGGQAAFSLPEGDRIDTMIGYATFRASDSCIGAGKPVLLITGADDMLGTGDIKAAYDALEPTKRYVSVEKAAHNSFTDQCSAIYEGNNFLQILIDNGFMAPDDPFVALAEDGCIEGNLPPDRFQSVVQHFTVAHLKSVFGIPFPAAALSENIVNTFDGIKMTYLYEEQPNL